MCRLPILATTQSGCASAVVTDINQIRFLGHLYQETLKCCNGVTTLCINGTCIVGTHCSLLTDYENGFNEEICVAAGCHPLILTQDVNLLVTVANGGSAHAAGGEDPTVALVSVPELVPGTATLPIALMAAVACVLLEKRQRRG
jgi:hypothetical protein